MNDPVLQDMQRIQLIVRLAGAVDLDRMEAELESSGTFHLDPDSGRTFKRTMGLIRELRAGMDQMEAELLAEHTTAEA